MTLRELIVVLLLALAVAVEWLCCLGLLAMRNPFGRLHAIGPGNILAPLLVVAAVVAQEGFTQAALKTTLIGLVLFLTASVVTHALARTARVRETGELAAKK